MFLFPKFKKDEKGYGSDNLPNPSSKLYGARLSSIRRSWDKKDKFTILSKISTKVPDKGRFDQSALAVTWNSIFQPLSTFFAEIKGVPSSSDAQVSDKRIEFGSAITCLLISMSLFISILLKGEESKNFFILAGCSQLNAPPKFLELEALSFTGKRLSFVSIKLGPANLTKIPPPEIHLLRLLVNSSLILPTSGRKITEISSETMFFKLSIIELLNGFNALSKLYIGDSRGWLLNKYLSPKIPIFLFFHFSSSKYMEPALFKF